MQPYWIALLPGDYDGYMHRRDTLVMQMRHNLDMLSCEAYRVLQPRLLTKTQARERKAALLDLFNKTYGWNFRRLIVD